MIYVCVHVFNDICRRVYMFNDICMHSYMLNDICMCLCMLSDIIQLMTFHKVDTVIYQPRGSDVHRSQRLR